MIIGVVIGLAVGLAIGIAWAVVRNARVSGEARVVAGRLADAQQRLAEAQAVAVQQQQRLVSVTAAAHDAETERAVLENELRVLRHHEGEAAARAEAERRMLEGTFARLSEEALARTSQQFLALADTRFGQARTAAQGDLSQRQEAIEQLLHPFRETLARYERGVQDMERQRQNAYSTLNERVAALREGHERLQQETHNLVTALRSPQTRGRWGEMTLRRSVEAAGMLAHVDFDEQQSTPRRAVCCAPTWWCTSPAAARSSSTPRFRSTPSSTSPRPRTRRIGRASSPSTPDSCAPTSTNWPRRSTGSSTTARPSSWWPSSPVSRCWPPPVRPTARCRTMP